MTIIEWITANPKLGVLGISFCVTLVMTLVTKYFTDQNRMKELKEIQKACNIKLKGNKDNPEVMAEIQKEMMECSLELMKHSFKPMFITFLPLILFFWWVRGFFSEILSGWILWYIGASIVSSMVLRKLLKVV